MSLGSRSSRFVSMLLPLRRLVGDTSDQVGPIPITNESTYTSLDWATTKGSATIHNYNADEDLQTEFFVSYSPPLSRIEGLIST